MLLLLWKSRVQVSQLGRNEKKIALLWLRTVHPLLALWKISIYEFFSRMQLEYCLREPLSKFEDLSTFYCNCMHTQGVVERSEPHSLYP